MTHISTVMKRWSLSAMGKSGLAQAVQPIFGGLGAVLMFHHVGHRSPSYFGPNDHLSIHPDFLKALLDEFRQECIDIVSVDEAIRRMHSAYTSRPFVALTFDDGYRDNIETAYPILQSFRVPFTLFVCTGFVDRQVPIWWLSLEQVIQAQNEVELVIAGHRHLLPCVDKTEKRRAFDRVIQFLHGVTDNELRDVTNELFETSGHDALALVDNEMSTWDMLKKLNEDPLVTIGAHTVSHPFLSTLSADMARLEMVESCDRIKEVLGEQPKFFAYPYGYEGAVGAREVSIAQDVGFEAAFTTRKGLLASEHSQRAWSLPRVSINGHYQNLSAMRALLSGLPFFVSNGFNRVTAP